MQHGGGVSQWAGEFQLLNRASWRVAHDLIDGAGLIGTFEKYKTIITRQHFDQPRIIPRWPALGAREDRWGTARMKSDERFSGLDSSRCKQLGGAIAIRLLKLKTRRLRLAWIDIQRAQQPQILLHVMQPAHCRHARADKPHRPPIAGRIAVQDFPRRAAD